MVDDDRLGLLGRGKGLVAGIVDPDGRPYALRAWAVTPIDPDGRVVRVVLGDEGRVVGDWIVGTAPPSRAATSRRCSRSS